MASVKITLADKFCKCLQTLREMLQDRGMVLVDEVDEGKARDNLKQLDLADPISAQLLLNSQLVQGTHPFTGADVKVYWLCGKIGVNSPTLEKVRETMANEPNDKQHTVIFVTFEGSTISAPAKKDLVTIPATIEFFDSSELITNITKHELQPKFKLLTTVEAEHVKRIYGATNEQFPKMLKDDPIRRYFGAKKGDIFRCKRTSENGVDPMYRIVEG